MLTNLAEVANFGALVLGCILRFMHLYSRQSLVDLKTVMHMRTSKLSYRLDGIATSRLLVRQASNRETDAPEE